MYISTHETSSIRFSLHVVFQCSNFTPNINANIILRRVQDIRPLPSALVVRSFQRPPEENVV